MATFGKALRQHRQSREISLRHLGRLTQFGFTYLSQVERGERKPNTHLAERCDEALEAHGALVKAFQEDQAGDIDMHRRTVLKAMGSLAANPLPLVQWEALRHGMTVALGSGTDGWEQTVLDYGVAHYRIPADKLMDSLRADLTVLQALISVEAGPARGQLLRTAAHLAVLVGLCLASAGQSIAAARWRRDAMDYADASRDPDSIVLTRAWDVVNGCYDGRPPSQLVALADHVLPISDARSSAATCGLLAGRAQALSLDGRHQEAIVTVQQLEDVVERLPSPVLDDVKSLWGWPEHRLRHTEAWVFGHAGDLVRATQAQERAVDLYPAEMTRLRSQVQLHHAAALIRSGHIPDGLRQAADVLDELPSDQHNELLRTVARQVIEAVPTTERRRPTYRELAERVDL